MCKFTELVRQSQAGHRLQRQLTSLEDLLGAMSARQTLLAWVGPAALVAYPTGWGQALARLVLMVPFTRPAER
jgi:hypothetical protein